MATAIVSFGKAGDGFRMPGQAQLFTGNPFSTEAVTTSGTSAATTAAAPTEGVARITMGAAGYIVIGASPTATATTGWYAAEAETIELCVVTGDKVAIIDA